MALTWPLPKGEVAVTMNDPARTPIKARLTDAQVADVNASFHWLLWFYDAEGRKIGGGKTQCIHGWNDERVVSFIERFSVSAKRILEPGCLEGIMTCALCHAGGLRLFSQIGGA
jgi:hypothetical protein